MSADFGSEATCSKETVCPPISIKETEGELEEHLPRSPGQEEKLREAKKRAGTDQGAGVGAKQGKQSNLKGVKINKYKFKTKSLSRSHSQPSQGKQLTLRESFDRMREEQRPKSLVHGDKEPGVTIEGLIHIPGGELERLGSDKRGKINQ